jgi:predicted DNA-binding transcriptional regulator AlpA
MISDDNCVLREAPASRLLGVSKSALRRWRREGRGPKYIRMERCIGYLLSDLREYLSQHRQNVGNEQ